MAVIVTCGSPSALLQEVKAAIQGGSVDTWFVDSDGDLTHSPPQWRNQAWFRPRLEQGRLVFYILGKKGQAMTKPLYGVYHGRLIEMLLTHFDLKFTQAFATALPITGDNVRPPS